MIRKLAEWETSRGTFRLTVVGSQAELLTPEGQSLELLVGEWSALAEAISEIVPLSNILERRRSSVTAPRAPNNGQPWSQELDKELCARWGGGMDVRSLATHFGRSTGGIASRLAKLGVVASRDEARARRGPATRPAVDPAVDVGRVGLG